MLIDEKPPLDEVFLIHFGILGMKWGHRKEKSPSPSSGVSTRSSVSSERASKKVSQTNPLPKPKEPKLVVKKHFGLTAKHAAVGASVLLGMGVAFVVTRKYGQIKAAELMRLERGFQKSTLFEGKQQAAKIFAAEAKAGHPSVFPLGHQFTRISSVAETELRNGSFASYRPKDIARYTSTWGDQPHMRRLGNTSHKLTIKTLGEIKAPSLSERFATMTGLVDKKHPDLDGQTLRQWLVKEQNTTDAKDWVKQASAAELGKYHYSNLTGVYWDKDPVGRTYMKELRRKGFSVMTDDRDNTSIAEAAMVFINKNMFKITESKELTPDLVKTAREEYIHMLLS